MFYSVSFLIFDLALSISKDYAFKQTKKKLFFFQICVSGDNFSLSKTILCTSLTFMHKTLSEHN